MKKKITLTELRNIISEVLLESDETKLLNDYVKAVEKRLDEKNILNIKKGQNIVIFEESENYRSRSFTILFSVFRKENNFRIKMTIDGESFFNIDNVFKKLEEIKKELGIEFRKK